MYIAPEYDQPFISPVPLNGIIEAWPSALTSLGGEQNRQVVLPANNYYLNLYAGGQNNRVSGRRWPDNVPGQVVPFRNQAAGGGGGRGAATMVPGPGPANGVVAPEGSADPGKSFRFAGRDHDHELPLVPAVNGGHYKTLKWVDPGGGAHQQLQVSYVSTLMSVNDDGELSPNLESGSADYQMLRWNNTTGKWVLLAAPDTDYKVLQRLADNSIGWDWVRAHG